MVSDIILQTNAIVEKADLTQTQMNDVMISKFKSFDSEFTKVDVILEKSNAIDVQTSTIKAGQQEIKSRKSECRNLVYLGK